MAYMKDSKGRRLDAYPVQGENASNVATRIIGGRMGTFDASTQKTFQLTLETADHFDAVRIIFASTDRINSHAMLSCAASVTGSRIDLNNSAGTWVAGSRQGQTQIFSEVAPSGPDRVTYTLSDWIPISSIARTDSGTNPLLVVRAYMSATATLPVYGNGTDDFTNWASRTDRRMWAARYQDGDQATAPTGFTSTTNRSQTPIVGVQYLARGQVITVAGVGDSITEGQGTYLGEGFIFPAIESLSDSQTKYEYMNVGWSGQSMDRFTERALDILESEIRPDVLVIPAASPNDIATTIAATDITAFRSRRSRIVAAAKEFGVAPVVWTWLPTNTAVKNYGATDSLRTAYNTEVLAQAGRNLVVADTSTAVSGSTSGGQVQLSAGSQSDGIHPNDTGNATLTAIIKPAIEAASRKQQARTRPTSTRASAPVFGTTNTSVQISKGGVWIFRGGGSAFWTLPPLTAGGRQDSQIITVKVRDSAGTMQISRSGSDAINYVGTASSSVIIRPGMTLTFIPGENGIWEVLGQQPTVMLPFKRDSTAALTLDKTASLYVFTGSAATTWTLPGSGTAKYPGLTYTLKNRGSADITLVRSGTDTLYTTAQVNSITITAGSTARVCWDGFDWLVI